MKSVEATIIKLQEGLDTPLKELLTAWRRDDMRWREIAKILECGYWELIRVAQHYELASTLTKAEVLEIAEKTGLAPGSVRVRLQRCKRKDLTLDMPKQLVRRPWRKVLGMPLVQYLKMQDIQLSPSTVMDRMDDGWPMEEAVHTPQSGRGGRPSRVWKPLPGVNYGDRSNMEPGYVCPARNIRRAQARRGAKMDNSDRGRGRQGTAAVDNAAEEQSDAA